MPNSFQTLDIPTIEWSGSGLKLDLSQRKEGGEFVTVTQELFDKATVSDLYEGLRALEEHKIGYPLMVRNSLLSVISLAEFLSSYLHCFSNR